MDKLISQLYQIQNSKRTLRQKFLAFDNAKKGFDAIEHIKDIYNVVALPSIKIDYTPLVSSYKKAKILKQVAIGDKRRKATVDQIYGRVVQQYQYRGNGKSLTTNDMIVNIHQLMQQQGKYPYYLRFMTLNEGDKQHLANYDIGQVIYEGQDLWNLLNKRSDQQDLDLVYYSLRQIPSEMALNENVRVHNRKTAMGDEDINIKEVDVDGFYIPTSLLCGLKCLIKIGVTQYNMNKQQVVQGYDMYFKKQKKSCRDLLKLSISQEIDGDQHYDNINVKQYNNIAKKLGISSNVYDVVTNKHIKSHHTVTVVQQHFCYIKNNSQAYNIAKNVLPSMILKSQKPIEDRSLDYKVYDCQSIKRKHVDGVAIIKEQSECMSIKDVFVWDLETLNNNGVHIPYVAGLIKVSDVYNISTEQILATQNDIVQVIHSKDVGYPEQCIEMMLDYLDDMYADSYKYKQSKAKNPLKTSKIDVYLYAHNGKGYDTWQMLMFNKTRQYENIVKAGSNILDLSVVCKNIIIHFRCTQSWIQGSLDSLCKGYKIDSRLCKSNMDYGKITKYNWLEEINEWHDYLQLDCISLSIIYCKFVEGMVSVVPIDLRKCISAASIAWQAFMCDYIKSNDTRDNKDQEMDENTCPNYKLMQYTDKYCRELVRDSVKGGRVMAYKEEFANIDVVESIESHYGCSLEEAIKKPQDVEFNKQLLANTDNYLVDADATSLYPSAMILDVTYPDVNSSVIINENLSFQTLNNTFPHYIVRCDVEVPVNLKFIPVPAKYSVRQWNIMNKINELGNDSIGCYYHHGRMSNQVFNDIDIKEMVKAGCRLINVYEGIGYLKAFNSPFKSMIQKIFNLRAENRKSNPNLADACKLILNSIYGKFVQKDIDYSIDFTTVAEYNNEICTKQVVRNKQVLPNGQVMYEKQNGQQSQSSMPTIIGSYILAYSKQVMNNFVRQVDGFNTQQVYYTDTDSLYISRQAYQKLIDANVVGGQLGEIKNDYGDGCGIIYGQFIGPKQKVVYLINEKFELERKMTFKGLYKSQIQNMTHDDVQLIKNSKYQVSEEKWLKQTWRLVDGIRVIKSEDNKRYINSKSQQQKTSQGYELINIQ